MIIIKKANIITKANDEFYEKSYNRVSIHFSKQVLEQWKDRIITGFLC
jgi:hypothetical protein